MQSSATIFVNIFFFTKIAIFFSYSTRVEEKSIVFVVVLPFKYERVALVQAGTL